MDVTEQQVHEVYVAASALHSFQFHHGGDQSEADVQLHSMLKDFISESARRISDAGYLELSRDGYTLVLSPDRETITGYSTVHRERTWEQVKAGVSSRFKRQPKVQQGTWVLSPEEAGAAVELSDFGDAFDPAAVHLTGRVLRSYAKIAGLTADSEDAEAAIRAAVTDLKSVEVVQRDDGLFEAEVAGRIWLVSQDCRLLIGVKNSASLDANRTAPVLVQTPEEPGGETDADRADHRKLNANASSGDDDLTNDGELRELLEVPDSWAAQRRETGMTDTLADELPMTRARLYVLLDAFERDIRSMLTRFILSEISAHEALGASFDSADAKRNQEGAVENSIVEYLDLREGYDRLNAYRNLLPEELATEVRHLTGNLDRLVPIRNRVMHARPLVPGDSYAAVSLLNQYQARYWSELKRTLAQLSADPSWEPITTVNDTTGYALNNLPLPDNDETGLLGRARETEEIFKRLKRGREPVLTITGEGGIGKTALALEVAYRIVDDPEKPFDAVLWTTLKYEKLTAAGVRNIAGAARDVTGAVQPLGQAFDKDFEGGLDDLATALEGLRVLVVVDNLETMGGNEFQTMYDTLPDTTNYLVTSRLGVGEIERRYDLEPLSRQDSLRLFNDFVRARHIAALQKLSGEARIKVVTSLRNSPLGIRWFALAVEAGRDPRQLIQHQDELLEFCVRSVYESLEPAAREVLLVLAILGRPVSMDELVVLLEKSTDYINAALQELLRGSLTRRENATKAGDLSFQTSLTETARQFLGSRVKLDTALERDITRRDLAYRTSEERRVADLANRSLAPYVVHTRSDVDNPTAQILRKALLNCRNQDFDGALAQISTSRKLNPDFWEVDRVEGFIRSQMGDLATATKCYKQAYANATGDDRAFVAFFFAGHLARKVRDVKTAIVYAREAHDTLGVADTAVALGSYLVWAHKFSDGIGLIEPATAQLQGKGRIIAIDKLAEAYQRWAAYSINEDKNSLLGHVRAKKGGLIALAALESGITDDKLRDTAADCCVTSLYSAIQCLQTSTTVPQLGDWLDALTSSIIRFPNSRVWGPLSAAIERLAAHPRCPVAGRRLAAAAQSIDAPTAEVPRKYSDVAEDGLIGEVVSLRESYGFVRHPNYPDNLYFHASSVSDPRGFESLNTGALVRFSVSQSVKGPRALNLIRAG